MTEFFAGLPGIVMLLAFGWILHNRPRRLYGLFRSVLGSGAFPEDGPKRESYERFLRVVGTGLIVFGILGIGFLFRASLLRG